MKKTLIIFLLFAQTCLFANILEQSFYGQPLVIHGVKATKGEMAIVARIIETLKSLGAETYMITKTDQYILSHQDQFDQNFLIVVGTYETNMLCRLQSNTKIFDRFNMSTSSEKLLQQIQKMYPFNISDAGFSSSEYGFYEELNGIGLVQYGISPLSLKAANLTHKKSYKPADMILITGIDSLGVQKAADAFLNHSLINGIVFTEGIGQKNYSRFRLGEKNLSTKLPKNFVTKNFNLDKGKRAFYYMGWMMGTLADFAKIKYETGILPQKIYQLKWREMQKKITPLLVKRTESKNSMMILEFANSAESLAALKTIAQKRKFTLKIEDNGRYKLYTFQSLGKNWFFITTGKYLIVENFDSFWKESIRKKMAQFIR